MNNLNNIIGGLTGCGIEFLENEPLSFHTSIKVGGVGALIIFPKDERELLFIARLLKDCSTGYFIIGGGTNTLFKDERISLPVISLKKGFKHIGELTVEEARLSANVGAVGNIAVDTCTGDKGSGAKIRLKAGSGAALSQILNYAIKNCLGGCEFFFGIPGTLGGAVKMNAGSKESSISGIIESVDIITKDGDKLNIGKNDLAFSYRSLSVGNMNGAKNDTNGTNGTNGTNEDFFITGAVLSFERSDKSKILENINIFKERKLRQPLGEYSLGCIFKNPSDVPAGKVIEEIGFKGLSIGDAAVSDKHANFIINRGKATAGDIIGLIRNIQSEALLQKGIQLNTEIKII